MKRKGKLVILKDMFKSARSIGRGETLITLTDNTIVRVICPFEDVLAMKRELSLDEFMIFDYWEDLEVNHVKKDEDY